jgi:hypothetical protein
MTPCPTDPTSLWKSQTPPPSKIFITVVAVTSFLWLGSLVPFGTHSEHKLDDTPIHADITFERYTVRIRARDTGWKCSWFSHAAPGECRCEHATIPSRPRALHRSSRAFTASHNDMPVPSNRSQCLPSQCSVFTVQLSRHPDWPTIPTSRPLTVLQKTLNTNERTKSFFVNYKHTPTCFDPAGSSSGGNSPLSLH